MAKIIVDGIELEAQPKQTIMQITDGINNGGKEITDIPRFCYHASLSIAGNCRMCLVEMGMIKKDKEGKPELDAAGKPTVAWIPKLTTACSTEIVDGMYVRTHKTSPVVAEAQKGVLEFILINHPLDCPICDQAGECPLQETTYKYGPEGSRFEFEKVHKPKRVAWGEKITFDGERCINCTRCVRFYDEYTKTSELEIVQRGWNNYPNPSNPSALNENPYAMNVIDLCPVGALTNTDYRFKSRVWEMSATDTISVNDARSSNIVLWVRDNIVMRITPRDNMQVNGYFIPDADRLNYKWINDNRANAPKVKDGGKQKVVSWNEAAEAAAAILKFYKPEEIFVMASAKACTETNYIAKKLATEIIGTTHIDFMRHFAGEDDHLLIRADKTPNAAGCELLGIEPNGVSKEELSEQIKLGKIKCLVVIEDQIEKLLSLDTLLKLDSLIVLPYNDSEATELASVVLPAATFA
ncbi:MAG: (2Fe-2S)-binding protein, partial [Rhizobacter sp.]|nr:(2Fe-2S)-binding protein [Chlorobiales bacterium]